tara:strand:+ start:726 stop:956 length:231 start_codon:yes stop_codon:yes gene_type:complete
MNKYFTEKEILEIGCFIMNKPVLKEWEEFKKTSLFRDSEFILIDFLKFLGFNDEEIKIGIMQRTEQIEQFEEVFKY